MAILETGHLMNVIDRTDFVSAERYAWAILVFASPTFGECGSEDFHTDAKSSKHQQHVLKRLKGVICQSKGNLSEIPP